MKIGILIFDNVEILDAMGPFEVFGVATSETDDCQPSGKDWQVCLISNSTESKIVTCRTGLKVIADYDVNDCPLLNVLLIPGGAGSRIAMKDPATLQFVREQYYNNPQLLHMLSVCTGALIVLESFASDPSKNSNTAAAEKAVSSELRVTTHHTCFELLESTVERINNDKNSTTWKVIKNQRVVDNGKIVFSGGITAGIDMCLYMLDKLLGRQQAILVAKEMEYHAPFLEGEGVLVDSHIGGDCWPKLLS